MFSTAARCAGVIALVLTSLACTLVRAQDDADPVYEGQKVSKWIDTVQKDPSARKRALGVEALGKIWILHKHKDAIPNVCRALRVDTSAAVRTQAALVLGGLRKEDKELGSKTLIDTLATEKESRVRKEIIAAMSKFPEVCALAVDPLIEALKDTDAGVRVAAAEALALAGAQTKTMAKSAAPGLVPLLKDPDKAVRLAAVYALGRIEPEGAASVAETMAAMLGTEKDADMKRELIISIGLLSEKAEVVVKALAVALSDANDEVRRAAARTLGTFGLAAAPVADVLFRVATTDKQKDIRVDALHAFGSALGPIGVKARLKDLRPLLDPAKEQDFEVRLAVVEEIGALGFELVGADVVPPPQLVAAMVGFASLPWQDFERDATTLFRWCDAHATLSALRQRQADPQIAVRKAAGIAVRNLERKPEPKKEPEKKEP